MIISASRRTDLPAFYSEWFLNRIRAGFCMVRNPFQPGQVSRVSLLAEDVDAIVFWSKNPAPLILRLDELDQRGYRYYFQFTLNDYSNLLEPVVPPLKERLETFQTLSRRLGKSRVIWRYDPIILSNITDSAYHRQSFQGLCARLADHTERVMVSVVDYYRKTVRNLARLEPEGFVFERRLRANLELDELLQFMAKTANKFGLQIFTCAEERNYSEFGIPPGRCIDGELIQRLWGLTGPWKKDPGQRQACGCAASKDIGENDSCLHHCPYCYATRDPAEASRKFRQHNPGSTALFGNPEPSPPPAVTPADLDPQA
jgi:hypothetical protein